MNQFNESEPKAMFNMISVGRKISELRKQANLTQMELADKLDISFQAVSNWERGQTMPDISKLNELSEIFNVSIDEILENERAGRISKAIISNRIADEDISVDELEEIAPILKPDQMDEVVEGVKGDININNVLDLAPFLSQKFLDELAEDALKDKGLKEIVALAPFLSQRLINESVKNVVAETKSLSEVVAIAPFISEKLVDELAAEVIEEAGIREVVSVAPFLSQKFIDENVLKIVSKNSDAGEIVCIAPFISRKVMNEIAQHIISQKGLTGLSPIMPFVDSKVVERAIKSRE